VHLGKGDKYVKAQKKRRGKDICPENDRPHRGGEIAEMLGQSNDEKNGKQERNYTNTAFYHPAFVVFSDESVNLLQYYIVVCH
jgi:hypothetical protein